MAADPATGTAGLAWRELFWRRPLDADAAVAAVRAWATDSASPVLVLEVRSMAGRVRYLLGAGSRNIAAAIARLQAAVPDARVVELPADVPARSPVRRSARLLLSTRHRALQSSPPEVTVRQLLGAMAATGREELLVLQLLLGPRRIPLAVPNNSPSSVVMPAWQVAWLGNGGTVDPEKRAALRTKVADHGFAAVVRIGADATSPEQAAKLVTGVLAAVRMSETAGLQARLARESAERLNAVRQPGFGFGALGWPLRLNAGEVVTLSAWPVGADDIDLPGLPPEHPKRVAPLRLAGRQDRVVADADTPGVSGQLGYGLDDAFRHTWVIGPTGTGKSTLLLNLIEQDLVAGHAVVVIEPNDLITDLLARIPKSRQQDVVLLDPTDEAPVGINPLARHGRRPDLVADSLLATFQALYGGNGAGRGEALGPRSTDILSNCLQALARHGEDGDTSLVMLPLLLTNPGFRRSVTQAVVKDDPIGAGPFWGWFDSLSDEARSQVVSPLMNKLRPLLRPGLRAVLGQRRPRFNVRQVLTEGKVLLVPLQPGVIGPDSAELLGALVVSELWIAARERRSIPEKQRRPVMVYLDEVQSFLRLPTDLADALATSRSLRIAWHLAHQYLGQLSPGMRAAFESNARSRICFQLVAGDARAMAAGQSVLTAEDFTTLPAHHVYAALVQDGQVTPWASGRTRPAPGITNDPVTLRRLSRDRYGQPLEHIEADFADLAAATAPARDEAPGRRRRNA